MKKTFIMLLAVLLFAPFLYAQNFHGKEAIALAIEKPAKKLNINESLNYSVEWLGIPVGKINLHVEGVIKIDGRDCYLIAAKAWPNNFFKKFYDFEYNVNTLIDSHTFLTRRFEKTRRIGKDSMQEIIDFNRENNSVHYTRQKKAPSLILSFERIKLEQDIPSTYELAPNSQDLFSALYYFRIADIKPDDKFKLNIYYSLRNWQVVADIGRPFIKSLRKKGSLAVFNVRLTSLLNTFVLGKQDMEVVFSADSRRIPVLFKFGSGIGTFRGVLEELPK